MPNNDLISVNEAKKRILAEFQPKSGVAIPLQSALARVLTEKIIAPMDLPPFDNSSMDGFAVLADDTESASAKSPVRLSVIEDIPAGNQPRLEVFSMQAARIMTGAKMPAGANAVVPVENTNLAERYNQAALPETIEIRRPVQSGENVRPTGLDIRKGTNIFQAGHQLRPQDLGFLAGLGIYKVEVSQLPRIAMFSSGDELANPGQPLLAGQIYNVNSTAIRALLQSYGADVLDLGVALDRYEDVKAILEQAVASKADLILSTAGVSMGTLDFIKRVLEDHGSLNFWKVNMRPGKPLTFGNYRGLPFIGLPGNPVSAYVGSRIFIRPIIQHLTGLPTQEDLHDAILGEDVFSDGRESYLRVRIQKIGNENIAFLTQHQGSGNVYSLVCANALLIIPTGVKSLAKGTRANFITI